jgi:hypothetical protein
MINIFHIIEQNFIILWIFFYIFNSYWYMRSSSYVREQYKSYMKKSWNNLPTLTNTFNPSILCQSSGAKGFRNTIRSRIFSEIMLIWIFDGLLRTFFKNIPGWIAGIISPKKHSNNIVFVIYYYQFVKK